MNCTVSLDKWAQARQPKAFYQKYPELVSWLASAKLISQMRLFQEAVREEQGEPQILVQGEWTSLTSVQQRFETAFSPLYRETFLVEKATRKVWSYLSRGLTPHHPYQDFTPLMRLSEEEFALLLNHSKKFCRKEEMPLSLQEKNLRDQDRSFVLQIVTSYQNRGESNFSKTLINPHHAYLRLIIGADNPDLGTHQGEVYEVGLNRTGRPPLPLAHTQGVFRSPDIWEYIPAQERIVTSIPITQEEARAFYEWTNRYHQDALYLGREVDFHILRQNCLVFARAACRTAHITIPTKISLGQLVQKIAPHWALSIQGHLQKTALFFQRKILSPFPSSFYPCLQKISNKAKELLALLAKSFLSLVWAPLKVLLGQHFGKTRTCLEKTKENKKNSSFDWGELFSLSKPNVPYVLQQWQRAQPSTVIYPTPLHIAILPT